MPVAAQADRVADLQRLWEQHATFVRELLARLLGPGADVDDLRQEVFLVAWRKRELLDGTLPARPWLVGISVRVAAATRRKARVRRFLGLSAAPERADRATPETLFEQAEASRVVYEILDRLSERKRTVFVLHELQGLTSVQIGMLVGCPPETVRTRLLHARREFQECLNRRAAREQALAQGGSRA